MIYLPFTNGKSVNNLNQDEEEKKTEFALWMWGMRPRGGTPVSQEHRAQASGQTRTRNRNGIEKEKYLKYNFAQAIIFCSGKARKAYNEMKKMLLVRSAITTYIVCMALRHLGV